ncbi:hypothetical protein [Pectobacterium brasiliense]|uniref:hypothetical protein n=1 Tax=Pectobacterium brasiliense TaxID=180957 RepID=UPI003CEEBDC4
MSHSQEGSSINNKEISHLKNEYIKFTEFLCSVIGEDKFKKSKFWFFQKQLSKLHELDLTDQKKLLSIINKYGRILPIFEGDIDYLKSNLLKIVAGSHTYSNLSESHNDFYFEFDMALRYLLGKGKKKINITSDCDIIIDDDIAIECKFLHGENGFEHNIRKAEKQIVNRIESGLAKRGFISIDLSQLVSGKDIQNFIDTIFLEFLNQNKVLGLNTRDSHSQIPHNKNFQKIIAGYINQNIEYYYYKAKKTYKHFKLDPRVCGVFFQYEDTFLLDSEELATGLPIRIGCYDINKRYIAENQFIDEEALKKEFHSLANGI